jgi:hypothetical protein
METKPRIPSRRRAPTATPCGPCQAARARRPLDVEAARVQRPQTPRPPQKQPLPEHAQKGALMHELIVSPFLGGYLLVRPVS